MKTIIIITLGLFIVWYLNKTSKNFHFFKTNVNLLLDYELCKQLLVNFQFKEAYIKRFSKAYSYFIAHPNEYNGTSVLNDRFMIRGLEPQSVIHDYDWIFATSLKELLVANYNYAKALRQVNCNWFYCYGFIFVSLSIISVFKSIKYIKTKK